MNVKEIREECMGGFGGRKEKNVVPELQSQFYHIRENLYRRLSQE